jgi:hypothetical protein
MSLGIVWIASQGVGDIVAGTVIFGDRHLGTQ